MASLIEIDQNRKLIAWYLDKAPLYTAEFWQDLRNNEIYPFVNLYNNGDIIEFEDE
jgi:beta-glucanase (GH16 family)